MKKGKILHVGYNSMKKAGVQTVIMEITKNLYNYYDFDVLVFSNLPGELDNEFTKYGKIHRINCYYKNRIVNCLAYVIRPFKQFFQSYKLLKREKYDIVHIHNGFDSGPILIACYFAKIKRIVVHSHNSPSPEKRSIFSKVYRAFSQYLIHKIANVRIGCSEQANKYLFKDDYSFVVNNPVNLDAFNIDNHPKKTHKSLNIANVGRYSFQKNQMFLIDIFAEIMKLNKNSHLYLVGFGDNSDIINKAKQKNILEYIDFLPANTDIPKLFEKIDAFVFPSRHEGLGIALIEAQAMDICCICSDVVPKETNVGLCTYVNLAEDQCVWAKKIMEIVSEKADNRIKLDKDRIMQFDIKNIAQVYKEVVYNNEKN